MKRIFLFLIGSALLAQSGFSAESPSAVLYKKDGRAWRVFLVGNGGNQLTIRLEKSQANTTVGIADVDRLEIKYPKYDEALVQQRFNAADYPAVIAALEPVATPAADYMAVPNNLQEPFGLLMKAYYENGDISKAREASARLMSSPDVALRTMAQAYRALSAIAEGDMATAESIRAKMSAPAAQLYILACIQRAGGDPQKAIQTAVELIATHPNDMNWMPLTELLCAELYLEMGMPVSADATARQAQKLYLGTNVEKEALALRSTISESMDKPE